MSNYSKTEIEKGAFCPMQIVMQVLGGKWKFVILYSLMDKKPKRFKVLERGIAGIKARMLIKELKSLEAHGLVKRTAYPTVPPTVEYQLTEYGISLLPVIEVLDVWGRKHQQRCDKKTKSAKSKTSTVA